MAVVTNQGNERHVVILYRTYYEKNFKSNNVVIIHSLLITRDWYRYNITRYWNRNYEINLYMRSFLTNTIWSILVCWNIWLTWRIKKSTKFYKSFSSAGLSDSSRKTMFYKCYLANEIKGTQNSLTNIFFRKFLQNYKALISKLNSITK